MGRPKLKDQYELATNAAQTRLLHKQERWRLRNIQKGRCRACTKPALPGRILCEKHQEIYNSRKRLERKKLPKIWYVQRGKANGPAKFEKPGEQPAEATPFFRK